jgi:(2R)-sulfolactate sulfo-lyase subunit alpha
MADKPQFLLHADDDNVAVAVADLKPGKVTGACIKSRNIYTFDLLDEVPLGHKFALKDLKSGDAIMKYGIEVGEITADVKAGGYVHIHNMRSKRWLASRS